MVDFVIAGPRGPISYSRDVQGFPSIRARDHLDGTFARGYLHATDRLTQVQIWLVAARGRLMELLGDVPLARSVDLAVRSFNFQRGLSQQIASTAPQTRAWLQCYCDGFNAGARRRGQPLMLRLGGVPNEPLTPELVLLLYRLMCYLGLTSQLHLAEALLAELAVDQVSPRVLALLAGVKPDAATSTLKQLESVELSDIFRVIAAPAGGGGGGSNAFAVSAERSASGGALLMGEFHLEVGRYPPVPYVVHVEQDGDEKHGDYYQGVGLAGMPWVQAGRTDRVAWTYTYGRGDDIDILAERCADGQHQTKEGWQPTSLRTELVRVRGRRKPERWVFSDCDRGVIVGDARQRASYPCLRWSGLKQSYRDLDAGFGLSCCRSADDLVELHRGFRTMALGGVFADAEGAVASVHTGQIDRRQDDDCCGSPLPLLGWQQPASPAPAPETARPFKPARSEALIVTANEQPPCFDGICWSTLPEPSYRHDRLREILSANDRIDLPAMVRASYDQIDLCARRMMPIWGPLLDDIFGGEALFGSEARSLQRWAETSNVADGRAEMGLFHALHHELVRALLEPHLGADRTHRLQVDLAVGLTFQHHLDEALALQRPALLDRAGLRQLLARAWPAAIARTQRKKRRWWAPLRERFVDFLSQGRLPWPLGYRSTEHEIPGSPVTPFQARIVQYQGQRMFIAPAFHLLFDMSKRGGWYNVPAGASERKLGPGYGTGIDTWLSGRLHPLGTEA